MLHVALYHPAIPPNTGNVSRQCVGMNAHLHLIAPQFEVSSNTVKRAGLDYWEHLQLSQHDDEPSFLDWLGDRQPWLVTKFGKHRYDQPDYRDEDVLIFGNENTGLPESWHERWNSRTTYIPILGQVRSYNLSNSVALVLAHATLKAGLYPV
jgi:tRNA (cytidine/uridine-2'-O-)-methyltransferase